MTNQQHTRALLGAIAALGLSAPSAFAATYTLTPGVGAQDWNTAATWGGSGTPGSAALDVATVSGDFGGVAQTVNISTTLANPLTTLLTIGDTNATPAATTIGSTGGSLAINGATINSAGTAGAVNTISAPILLSGGLTFASSVGGTTPTNNVLTVTGKITPTAAAARTIENDSVKTVTLGDIDISTGASTATLTIRSGTTAAATAGSNFILNGTIADGSSVASALTLGARSGNTTTAAQSFIQINGNNTYTGNTTLGVQGNVVTYFKINSDQPFGPADKGAILFGGNTSGSASSNFEAVGSDRTITKNNGVLARSIGFNGSNSVTLASSTITGSNNHNITNDITASGKVATIGTVGGVFNLNNNNTDLIRTKTFLGAGTTIIASNINDNSPALAGGIPATSRMFLVQGSSGKLVFTGTNAAQGSTRISANGTVQIGNGGTTGSLTPSNGIAAVVNGTGTGGTLAFNRSDATTQAVVANGAIGIAQIGAGAVSLTNSQFNSGANSIGDGFTASKLIVSGSSVNASNTTTGATISNGSAVSSVTLNGSDTVAGLNLKVGRPVWLTSGAANTLAYIDSITDSTHFTVSGGTLLTAGAQSLSFGAGSALGTSAATTTVNNLGTLAGTGTIAGSVNALAGSFLAPGAVDGAAGTLSTGALSLTGTTLRFDLASTAAGVSDSITSSGTVAFSALTFDFNAITAGVLDTSAAYNLVTTTAGFTGDATQIATAFSGGLSGLTASYSVNNNILSVAFAAIPEPSSFAALAGMAALGGCLVRRRRKAQA